MEKYLFNPKDGQTVLEPEGKGQGYWIGAPFVYHDKDLNKLFLYVRTRNPRPKVGKVNPLDTRRGYKCQIYESIDGVKFDPIWEMRKHQINAKSIEGAALIKIKEKYHIFLSYESHSKIPRWKIKKAEAMHPSEFQPKDFHPVNWNIPQYNKLGIKDPIIMEFGNKYFLYIDFYRFYKKTVGSTGLLTSLDGVSFKWEGDILVKHKNKRCEWASLMIRLTSIFEEKKSNYIGFFDGTNHKSNLCEEKSGILIGQTPYKLRIWSCDKPSFHSDYGSGSVRYLFGMKKDDKLWIYYEYTEEQGEHVLKLIRI